MSSRRTKCRVRRPWWRVPEQGVPDLFVTYMNHEAVQLATNGARVRCLNSVHGVILREDPEVWRDLLPIAALNSVSLLSGEVVGRSFGGGMLQVLPREAGRMSVPGRALLEPLQGRLRDVLPCVRSLLRAGHLDAAVAAVDALVLRRSDLLSDADIAVLRRTRAELRDRRVARSRERRRSRPAA